MFAKLKKLQIKPKIIFTVLYFYFAWSLGNTTGNLYEGREQGGVYVAIKCLEIAINSILEPSFWIPTAAQKDISFGLTALLIAALLYVEFIKPKKKYRKGEEHGSAQFGTHKDIVPYIDKEFSNNILLSESERFFIDTRITGINNNILVVGGSGSGKTRFFIKPNLLQMHSSYVVTDPKGTIMNEDGQALVDNGYVIKTLNLINFIKSNKYNPFAYISKEHPQKDILILVEILITNTSGVEEKREDFWVKAERLLYTALISYLYYEGAPHEKNFGTLVYLLQQMEVREEDETFKNAIDILFDNFAAKSPDHFSVRQYKAFKLAAGKTAKSILISCAARLAPFDIEELRTLTEEDELQLEELGKRKTALFVIISDTDGTFNFLAAMMYSQLFNRLCTIADDQYGGKLPIPVRCLLDEFANIGRIPNFEKLIATIRSREISASIILQSKSQLKALYKDNANTIIGNCDSFVYLGGKDEETLKTVVEILGKETIDSTLYNETRGREKSSQQNNSILGRELMTVAELAKLPRDTCIVQIKGFNPFKSKKYDLTKHPNYKMTGDANREKMYHFKNTAQVQQEQTENYFTDVETVMEVDLSNIDFEKLA